MWYGRKVERDLERWRTAGWINDTGVAAIRADLASRKPPFGAAAILAMLGAVLFGFAVMSFVAANWTAMPKLVRLLLLLVTLWGCYGGAAWLLTRNLAMFAQAAVLAGIAVYGASIMLISQMYHMDGSPPDAVLLWALGALLAAVLVPSPAALAATYMLLVVWTCWERGLAQSAHWIFLLPWAAATVAAAWLRWRPGLHLAAVSFIAWLLPLGFLVGDHHAHWIAILGGIAVAATMAVWADTVDAYIPASPAAFTYAIAVAFSGLFIMQFIDVRGTFAADAQGSIGRLVVLAIISIALLLGAMLWSIRTDNKPALWVAYAAFAVEIFTLYSNTIGTLLNTSLFFFIAAIIVSALAYAAYRLHLRKPAAGAATGVAP
jgi:uncharacterized membrane protein